MKVELSNILKKITNKKNWKKFKFSDLVDNISEKAVPKKTELKNYIGLEHLDSGSLKIRRFGETASLVGNKQRIYKDDFILAKRNAYLKRVAICEFNSLASAHSFVLRAKPYNILKEFLGFFLLSELFWEKAIQISVGSLSPTINWKNLASQEFWLPEKNEQKKISDLFWRLHQINESNYLLLNEITSLYNSVIEKKLLNFNSKKTFFSSLGKIIRGVSYKPEDLINSYENKSCILLRSNNISDGKINYEDIKVLEMEKIKHEQLLNDDDFVICMSNGSKELVGKAAKFENREQKNVSIGSFCACFRPKDKNAANILIHLFSSYSYRHMIKKTLSGSAINNLKPSDIENLFLRIDFERINSENLISKLNSILENKYSVENSIQKNSNLLKSSINYIFNNVQ